MRVEHPNSFEPFGFIRDTITELSLYSLWPVSRNTPLLIIALTLVEQSFRALFVSCSELSRCFQVRSGQGDPRSLSVMVARLEIRRCKLLLKFGVLSMIIFKKLVLLITTIKKRPPTYQSTISNPLTFSLIAHY